MNFPIQQRSYEEVLWAAVERACRVLRAPPKLNLIEWADRYRYLAASTGASPGRWKTSAQPCAYGPMAAALRNDTHTVSIMAGTQIVKTEFDINICGYYIAQDPSAILFVLPTQSWAEEFSKERFAPTVKVSPQLRELVEPPKTRDSENTITHKEFPGGVLNFVGANSPSDLSSRPARVIISDEIDKFPPSAGTEGDPLQLAEERASTYLALGRAKFIRTCSPTLGALSEESLPISRIAREYLASDQRRLFVTCPHCDTAQLLVWARVRWSKDDADGHLPDTASIVCEACGTLWSERERIAALDALAFAPGYGWRQTKPFVCCGEKHTPSLWNDDGRSLCPLCEAVSPYGGHAGFHVSKLYSKRHRLADVVREFLIAKGDVETLKKWTNTALAELWVPKWAETFDSAALAARAEAYDGDDLPEEVKVITGYCDVQGDRLEIQLVGWGTGNECWPFKYTIINQDPAQPAAWRELDALLRSKFQTVNGRFMRIAAFGIDAAFNSNMVYSFCRSRRGRRIFACRGIAGQGKPIWPGRATRSKGNDPLYLLGVDGAKEWIYASLRMKPPPPGERCEGFIHFPAAENFGAEYFAQLKAERPQVKKIEGHSKIVWMPTRDRNEALDTFVGALAMRKALPQFIEAGLSYSIAEETAEPASIADAVVADDEATLRAARMRQRALNDRNAGFVGAKSGWMKRN